MEIALRWIIGYGIALAGSFVVGPFVDYQRDKLTAGAWSKGKNERRPDVSARLVGFMECAFFTLAVAHNMPGVIAAMMSWVAVKLAANWANRPAPTDELTGPFRLTAILGTLFSMGFALVGGLICRGSIWWPFN